MALADGQTGGNVTGGRERARRRQLVDLRTPEANQKDETQQVRDVNAQAPGLGRDGRDCVVAWDGFLRGRGW